LTRSIHAHIIRCTYRYIYVDEYLSTYLYMYIHKRSSTHQAIGPNEYAKLEMKRQIKTAIALAAVGFMGCTPITIPPTTNRHIHIPMDPYT
jgi:hypothetical protein